MPSFNLKDLKKIIFNKLSKRQYEKAIEDGLVKDDEFYLTPDTTEQDIADAIATHNVSSDAHNDIRTSIKDATLTIKQNDVLKGTFSANASEDVEINIEADPQEQADWEEEDETKASFIKHKPTLGTASEKDVEFFATSAQGELAESALQPEDVINDVTHTDIDLPLSANMGKELNDRIDAISARGRFLSTWDSTTGLAGTTPTTLPYEYKTGDYFIVKKVATEEGEKNYKPTGTTYTGEASTVEETNPIAINDTYYYDGTNWSLLHGADVQVTFASIVGDPYDNTELAADFNEKQDTLIAGDNITIDEDGKTISAVDTTYTAGDGIEISEDNEISAKVYSEEAKIVYGTDINSKQIVYTEGKNVEFEDYGGLLSNPSYQPIEYIKATSTAPSYITTGISFLSNHQYETEVVFQFLTTTTSGGGLFGRVANTSSTGIAYGLGIESGKYVAYYGVTSGENNKHTTSTPIDSNKHTLVIRDGKFTIDGVLLYEHTVTNITPAIDNSSIGTITYSGSQMSSINNAAIYSVKIKDLTTNTVLGMWVPVKDTVNSVGLWNTVAKNFNSNSMWQAGSNIDLKATINSLSKEYTAGKGINISTGGVITNTSPAAERLHISYGLTKYEIPVGYSAVEYLDFDGTDFFKLLSTASTTSIDGRMNWNSKTEATLIFEALENPTTEAPLFGTYYTLSSGGQGYWGVSLINGAIKGYAAENSRTIPLVLGQKITFKYNKSPAQISLNGTIIQATTSTGSYSLPSGIKIGNFESDPTTRTGGKFRLYEYKTYICNKISADVIPVIRNSDGVVGLYEMISGTFITPQNKNDGITAGTLAPDTAGLTIDTDRVLFNVADDPTSIIEGKIFQGRDASGILTNGTQAVAIGANLFVNSGNNCVVIGYSTSSTSGYSVILGCKAKSNWSVTTGVNYKEGAVVIGNEAVVNAPGGIVIGALSPNTTANQRQSATQARNSIVIGYESYVNSAPHSVVLGDHSYIHTNDVSQWAVTSSTKNVVIGSYSCVPTDNVHNVVVLGSDASANANNSIQIGAGTNNLSGTLKIRDTYLLWDSGKVNFEVLSRVTPTQGQVLCYDENEDGQGNLLSWKTIQDYTLTPATTTKLGGIIVGDYLNITSTGRLSVNVANADQGELGVVKPDGVTIIEAGDGEISVPRATASTLGIVRPDNETITISNGIISAKTNKVVVVNDEILSRDADGVIAWTIEHNLNSQDVMCSVKMLNDGVSEEIYPRIIYDDDEVTLYFNSDSAFLPNTIKVVIIG